MRPIIEMTGGRHFNECFFDSVRIPADHLVGAPGDGWRLATLTLANERVSLSSGGVLWSMGPASDDVFSVLRAQGGVEDPRLRQRAAALYTDAVVLRLLGYRVLTGMLRGEGPGPEVSVRKALADDHGQHLFELAHDLAGADGLLTTWGPLGAPVGNAWGDWHWGAMFSRALTIGGGTSEVQRNIIGERLLGLPREPSLGQLTRRRRTDYACGARERRGRAAGWPPAAGSRTVGCVTQRLPGGRSRCA